MDDGPIAVVMMGGGVGTGDGSCNYEDITHTSAMAAIEYYTHTHTPVERERGVNNNDLLMTSPDCRGKSPCHWVQCDDLGLSLTVGTT